MLELFHRFNLSLNFLLHALLSSLILIEDFQSHRFAEGFIFSNYKDIRSAGKCLLTFDFAVGSLAKSATDFVVGNFKRERHDDLISVLELNF